MHVEFDNVGWAINGDTMSGPMDDPKLMLKKAIVTHVKASFLSSQILYDDMSVPEIVTRMTVPQVPQVFALFYQLDTDLQITILQF